MNLIARVLTFALILWTPSLQAQGLRWGADGILGIHYNTLDAASYKTPVGYGGFGVHLTVSDPNDDRRIYFNGRLTFENDIETYTVFLDNKLDCVFGDLVASFQMHQRLSEKCAVYAGINLSFNMINRVWSRYGGTVFFTQGERVEAAETLLRQQGRKLNAGLEAGFMCPLGKRLSTGLQLSWYIMKRLQDDLEPGALGGRENVALNFRPVALKMQLTFDLGRNME